LAAGTSKSPGRWAGIDPAGGRAHTWSVGAAGDSFSAREESVSAREASVSARDVSVSAREASVSAWGGIRRRVWRVGQRTSSCLSVWGNRLATWGKCSSARGELTSAWGNPPLTRAVASVSARDRPVSARRQPVSARRQPVSVRRQPVSVRRQPVSARGRSVSARGRPVSARGRSVSARGRPVSGRGRSVSARGRSVSVRGRPVSARGRSVSVRGRPVRAWPACRGAREDGAGSPLDLCAAQGHRALRCAPESRFGGEPRWLQRRSLLLWPDVEDPRLGRCRRATARLLICAGRTWATWRLRPMALGLPIRQGRAAMPSPRLMLALKRR